MLLSIHCVAVVVVVLKRISQCYESIININLWIKRIDLNEYFNQSTLYHNLGMLSFCL